MNQKQELLIMVTMPMIIFILTILFPGHGSSVMQVIAFMILVYVLFFNIGEPRL